MIYIIESTHTRLSYSVSSTEGRTETLYELCSQWDGGTCTNLLYTVHNAHLLLALTALLIQFRCYTLCFQIMYVGTLYHITCIHACTCTCSICIYTLKLSGKFVDHCTVSGQREYAKREELSWMELLLGKRPKF